MKILIVFQLFIAVSCYQIACFEIMIFETREHVEFPLYLTLIVDINVFGRLITFIRIAVTRTNTITLF